MKRKAPRRAPWNPWASFAVFFPVLGVLAYSPLSLAMKCWIGLGGVLLPLFLVLYSASAEARPTYPALQERDWEIPFWAPFLVAGLAVFVRFYQLTSLSTWPVADEGLYSFYSIELSDQWRWRFFFAIAQSPPGFNWLLALFFKLFSPSLFSMWFFPALLSALSALAVFWAARAFFSRVFSMVCFTLFAFSFWSLYSGRFCMWVALLPLWEILTLGTLGWFLKEGNSRRRVGWALLLGFLTGVGFFMSIAWPAVVVLIVVAVYGKTAGDRRLRGVWGKFLSPLVFFALLFAGVAWQGGYGDHIREVLADPGQGGGRQWISSASYLGAFFINPGFSFHYGPLWGGMLNPVAGALFLLGMVECFRYRRSSFARWIFLALILLLAPGLISKNFDVFRILQVFPVLLVLAAMGARALWTSFPRQKIFPAILILLAVSSGLDLTHLVGPYHRFWGTPNDQWVLIKSSEFYRAHKILERVQGQRGPGAVLSDLWGETGDGTLTVATYAFDVVRNPRYSPQDAQWIALIVDANYRPFLAASFPKSRWYWLGNIFPSNPNGLVMGVFSMESKDQARLQRWIGAAQALRPATSWVLNSVPGRPQKPVFDLLFNAHDSMRGDPFLESCFWEKVFKRRKADNDPEGMLEALRQGLKVGYPLAHFYNEEGILLSQMGRKAEARAAFEKALRAPLNLTSAAGNLQALLKPESR